MSDEVKDYCLLYKWGTYMLMFYVGIIFYFMYSMFCFHILDKGYSHLLSEFDYREFFYSVVVAFFLCFYITIPMIIGVVVLIELFNIKWLKAYFIGVIYVANYSGNSLPVSFFNVFYYLASH